MTKIHSLLFVPLRNIYMPFSLLKLHEKKITIIPLFLSNIPYNSNVIQAFLENNIKFSFFLLSS
eukprot:CAMPEP_0194134592 /NCGR_PEP_ID=MMETSP0152-20130528/4663_1 /TAXON_ID=1049557 /ORGANISM="Thalassiothrix antarctica, Strain L6-D1" /LENGTH=63 /DNA_ID=CAMNT_0038830395 /DNA_START=149 /DNA_END=336 /DNA_ORIENTATION=+